MSMHWPQKAFLFFTLVSALLLIFISNRSSTSVNIPVRNADHLVGVSPRFRLGNVLGIGYVSTVYSGVNLETGQNVVIKLTALNETELNLKTPQKSLNGIPLSIQKLKRLDKEYDMYRRLNSTRLLKAFWYGRFENYQALVVQRVGKSLQEHQKLNHGWTIEDIYHIGVNAVLDLEQIHEQSFTHDDIHMVITAPLYLSCNYPTIFKKS